MKKSRCKDETQKQKTAFTLTETLITVVILGIVAAILVPNLINRQVENTNRTKVKKAMAAYEKTINFIILENDIKSTEELKEFGEEETCKFSKAYFKTVQDGANDCIFKPADRVWWDISDLTNPLIILKEDLKDESLANLQAMAKNIINNTVFAMVGRFDDLGTLRVNDNAYEQSQENNLANQKYVKKLWYFLTNQESLLGEFDICNLKNKNTCSVTKNGVTTTYTKVPTTNTQAGNYWISNNLGKISGTAAKSQETCNQSLLSNCLSAGDYYEAAKIECNKRGGHLPSSTELNIAYKNGKLSKTTWFIVSNNYSNSHAVIFYTNYGTNDGYSTINYKYKLNNDKIVCVGE